MRYFQERGFTNVLYKENKYEEELIAIIYCNVCKLRTEEIEFVNV